MRVYLLSILVMGLSLSFLWHFSNIIRFGTYLIHEPSKPVLYSEIAVMCSIFVVGVICFVLGVRERRKE